MVLSDKNTKKELLEGIAELTRKYEQAISGNSSPEDIIKNTTTMEVKERAEKIVSEPVTSIEVMFNKAVSDFRTATSDYYSLQDAIKLAREELEDYYNIKKEANTLLALLEAKKEAIQLVDEEKKSQVELWENKIKELSTKFETESKELVEKRKREQEQYIYDFTRKKKIEEDKLTDILSERRKQHDEELDDERDEVEKEREQLNKREEDIQKREEKIEDLENTISELQSYKDKYRDEIIKGNSAKKDHEHAIALINSDYENKLLVKESTIKMLTDTVERNNITIKELSNRLDEAYNNVKEVASNAVNGAVQGNMINTLKDVATNKDTKNTK
jgi:chromosome segregation ATPase